MISEDDDSLAPLDRQLWGRLSAILRPDLMWYTIAILAAPVSVAIGLLQPWLLKKAVDEHLIPKQVDGLQELAVFYLIAVIGAFGAETLYTYAIGVGAMRSITRIRRRIYEHTLNLSASFFDQRPTGRLLTRATSDVEALGETLTAGAVTIVLDVLVVIGTLIAMFSLDPGMTLVALLVGPPIAWFVNRVRKTLRDLFIEVRNAISVLNAYTAERFAGLDIVQLYSDEQRSLHGHDELLMRYRNANIRTNLWDALLYATIDGVSAITMALLIGYASAPFGGTIVTAGLITAFIDYIGRLFRPIQEFSAKVAVIQRASASVEKIFGILEVHEVITPGSKNLENVRGEIELKDVSFSYNSGPDILKHVSFHIQPGQVIALVGRTGSGKSSIARLLTRTYDGYRGSITFDGIELRELSPRTVRKGIGIVRQDVQLFSGDVRFNLTLGAEIPDEKLWEAIRLVQAEEAVQKLGGLDGVVHHQGANLSSGEAQLLSFARVMAHDPPVVLLDEATASVDTLTENRLQMATKIILERKTVIVIAHRLSTVIDADRIVVLSNGEVVETGSHPELMEQNGAWAALFRQQYIHREQPSA